MAFSNNSVNIQQSGIQVFDGTSLFYGRTLTAGSSKLSISNGSGVAGNPTLDVVPGNININSLTGYPLTVANGGTGITTVPTNGQVPIGNGANYVAATLTAGTGISITNGAGSITIDTSFALPIPPASGGTGTSTVFTAGSIVFAGASGIYTQNNSQLYWDNSTTALGVGTNTPASGVPTKVRIDATSSSFKRALQTTGTFTGSSGSPTAIYSDVSYAPSIGGTVQDIYSKPNFAAAAATTLSGICFYASPTYNGNAGTLASYGFFYDGGGPAVGTVSTAYGGWFANPTGGTTKIPLYAAGVSIGSYSTTAPPSNGLICSGTAGFGTSSPNSANQVQITSTLARGLQVGGTQVSVDGSSHMHAINVNGTYAPTSGAVLVSSFEGIATFQIPSGQTVTSGVSFHSSPSFTSNLGTITTMYGFWFDGAGSLPGGTISTFYGGYFATPVAGTTKVALYSGNAAIGYTATVPPSNGLIVSGQTGIGTSTISASSEQLAVTKGSDGYIVKWSDGTRIGGLGASSSQGGAFVSTFSNHPLFFSTNNAASQLWLATSGNLGVNTTTPQNKLDVSGAVAVGSYAGVNTAASNSVIVSGAMSLGASDATGARLYINEYSGSSTLLIQNSSGTSNSNRHIKLNIDGTDQAHIYAANGTLLRIAINNSGLTDYLEVNASGHFYPVTNKSQDLGLTGNRWNNIYYVSATTGTSRLAPAKSFCPECLIQMVRGTGTTITLGEEADYIPVFCLQCGEHRMEAIHHLPLNALQERRQPPCIQFLGFVVNQYSGNSRGIQVKFRYGDLENSTYLSDVEYEEFLLKPKEDQKAFLRELGLREWYALEEIRLMKEECDRLQLSLDRLSEEWINELL